MSHKVTIDYIKQANFSIIIRDTNRVTLAGFPTKFVESIACGTPVITNENSDIGDYIKNNGVIVNESNLYEELLRIFENEYNYNIEKDLFDYRKYIEKMSNFFKEIEK